LRKIAGNIDADANGFGTVYSWIEIWKLENMQETLYAWLVSCKAEFNISIHCCFKVTMFRDGLPGLLNLKCYNGTMPYAVVKVTHKH
jgi:hypothetical protein